MSPRVPMLEDDSFRDEMALNLDHPLTFDGLNQITHIRCQLLPVNIITRSWMLLSQFKTSKAESFKFL